jgi:hypothetical protein
MSARLARVHSYWQLDLHKSPSLNRFCRSACPSLYEFGSCGLISLIELLNRIFPIIYQGQVVCNGFTTPQGWPWTQLRVAASIKLSFPAVSLLKTVLLKYNILYHSLGSITDRNIHPAGRSQTWRLSYSCFAKSPAVLFVYHFILDGFTLQ